MWEGCKKEECDDEEGEEEGRSRGVGEIQTYEDCTLGWSEVVGIDGGVKW